MPRFVILDHDWPHRHWDFMLEAGGVLRTWRLAAPPEPGCAIAAEPLADHRLAYLEYEGPLTGDRGRVVRWDRGEFTWLRDGDGIEVELRGERTRGIAAIRPAGDGWHFTLTAAPASR
jgi:hypothetical protein